MYNRGNFGQWIKLWNAHRGILYMRTVGTARANTNSFNKSTYLQPLTKVTLPHETCDRLVVGQVVQERCCLTTRILMYQKKPLEIQQPTENWQASHRIIALYQSSQHEIFDAVVDGRGYKPSSLSWQWSESPMNLVVQVLMGTRILMMRRMSRKPEFLTKPGVQYHTEIGFREVSHLMPRMAVVEDSCCHAHVGRSTFDVPDNHHKTTLSCLARNCLKESPSNSQSAGGPWLFLLEPPFLFLVRKLLACIQQ